MSHPYSSHHDRHLLEGFYVVSTISNPVRYKSRYNLYHRFAEHMKESGVRLYTAEVAFGDRKHFVTESGRPEHLQLRTHDEMWHKECALNLMVQRLPKDWKYVAWIDADVHFHDKHWALETVHALQHHHVVQLFETAVDQGPTGSAMAVYQGFAASYLQGRPYPKPGTAYYPYWHSGFAWAMTREAFDGVGGLIDWALTGSGDHHMALALIGKGKDSLPGGVHPMYEKLLLTWQENAERFVRRDIGYVNGMLIHHFHGPKHKRAYQSRWKIVTEHKYDPTADIKRDWQGLYQLNEMDPKSISLRDALRRYFRNRDEDSNSAE